MKTVIIHYKAGNIRSVQLALERIGATAIISSDPDIIKGADKVIFPGVGEASTTMQFLREQGLDQLIPQLRQPVLGICLGMQLMASYSEEGDTECLGIFSGKVRQFPLDAGLKVPHVGWNQIQDLDSPLFKNIPNNSYCYFVHSYYLEQGANTIATTDYALPFSAAIQKDNFYATQFHPEKSGSVGEIILRNFVEI